VKESNARNLSSNEATILNLRKILVNAQITAMVSILEMTSTILYCIIVLFNVRSSYGALLQLLGLYLIIVPYSLLMNTSHNKNRVIEHGWKNVFKNLFGKYNNATRISNALPDNVESIQNTESKLKDTANGKSSENILTTSSAGNDIDANPNVSAANIPSLAEEEPSTSKGLNAANAENTGLQTLNVNNLPKMENNEDLSKKLVLQMFYHIDNEEQYIDYFKKLIAYDEGYKIGNSLTIVDLEEEFPSTLKSNTLESAVMKSTLKTKDVRGNITSSDKDENCPEEKMLSNNEKLMLEIDESGRINKRQQILKKLIACDIKHNNYAILIDELINMEESFASQC
jgi:hypothetical protein